MGQYGTAYGKGRDQYGTAYGTGRGSTVRAAPIQKPHGTMSPEGVGLPFGKPKRIVLAISTLNSGRYRPRKNRQN